MASSTAVICIASNIKLLQNETWIYSRYDIEYSLSIGIFHWIEWKRPLL